MNGGGAGVIMLWMIFAYTVYMNHLRQQEINYYIFSHEHMTYKDQRILNDWRKRYL